MTHQTSLFVHHEEIVLDKNGIWRSNGEEITHEGTLQLFSKSLSQDENGYFVSCQHERKEVTVEDTPYFVVRIDSESDKEIRITLNDRTEEPLDFSTLKYQPGRLTCRVKENQSEAKFLHAAYSDLLHTLDEDADGFFLNTPQGKLYLERHSQPSE